MGADVDVLIIGGGPAGLMAGIVFARAGLHTLLCEQRSLPADKACGEGIMPSGLAHLDHLGVKKHLSTGNYFPFKGIRYLSAGGKVAGAAFREGPGWGVPRLDLSAALLHRAQELDCLEIRAGVQARPLRLSGERVWVQVGEELVGTRLLVGADGLNSQVRRWAGLQGPRGPLQRWGVRQHFPVTPWNDYVEVHWKKGLEAYVTPCGENLVGVAFLWDRSHYPHLPGGRSLIPSLLEAFPALSKRLKDVLPWDTPRAIGPMQRLSTGPVAAGVLLAGDAAGYLDALTGEGISLAAAQALALETTILPHYLAPGRGEVLSRQDLADYERAYRSIVRPYYRLTRLALWLNQHPALVEGVIGLLNRRPDLFQSLLSANMGLASPYQIAQSFIFPRQLN